MATVFNTTIPVSQLSSPLILLPPNVVHKILIATHVHLGATSVLLWDVVNNLRNDWELVSSLRVGLGTLVYFLTRTSLLAYSLGRSVLLTHPVENCAKYQDALNAFLIVFIASTTFLFYIRVTTLYAMDKTIVILFGLAWLATVGVSTTFSIAFTAEHIIPTEYCIEQPAQASQLYGPTMLVQLVNDLLLYAALTHKAYQTFIADAIAKGTLDPLASRDGGVGAPFSTLTKYILLEPAQTYCLAVISTKIFLTCAAFAFPHPTSCTFMICHLVLVNIWCGRMYRALQRLKLKARPLDALPPMITQNEYELRLSVAGSCRTINGRGRTTTGQQEQTFTPDLEVRRQREIDKRAFDIKEEKRSSIYSDERERDTKS
ncbi:hypothetical protein BDN70DRAFT_879070 [Pholiota conissans]|uniref:Uncharacterized protein n=1 Tax=Pholiota conissans TaxID=109636 RepID=A0A9P5Z0K2_9AGAR|nr:hypothetical protein BDN70DRAFT_879070 [Pholiota conissans]